MRIIIYFFIISTFLSFHLNGQSSIGLNTSFSGAFGIQQEISFESTFIKKLEIGFRFGSNFTDQISYKMGFRYHLWTNQKTTLLLGFDLGANFSDENTAETKNGFRTRDLLIGVRQNLCHKLNGIFEVGLSNRHKISDPTPAILRIGVAYRL